MSCATQYVESNLGVLCHALPVDEFNLAGLEVDGRVKLAGSPECLRLECPQLGKK